MLYRKLISLFAFTLLSFSTFSQNIKQEEVVADLKTKLRAYSEIPLNLSSFNPQTGELVITYYDMRWTFPVYNIDYMKIQMSNTLPGDKPVPQIMFYTNESMTFSNEGKVKYLTSTALSFKLNEAAEDIINLFKKLKEYRNYIDEKKPAQEVKPTKNNLKKKT